MSSAPPPTLHVACLCAGWCRTCDAYEPVLQAQVAALREQGQDAQAHWIDIEDRADLLGDIDIETFPTVVVAVGSELRFAGVLTPQPQTLQRVLRAATEPAAPALQAPEFQGFVQRLLLDTKA